MTTLLVDGDLQLYRQASALEEEITWSPTICTLHSDPDRLFNVMVEIINNNMEAAGCSEAIVCFSDPDDNFRRQVYPSYKAGRGGRKPLAYWAVRRQLMEAFTSRLIASLEADDVLGITQTNPKYKGDTIIWSGDKDLKQIPGRHWDGKEVVEVSKQEADIFFYTQVLTGDSTDGYPGCPGIGPKTAEQILAPCAGDEDLMALAVLRTYQSKGQTEDSMLQQATCARILRYTDYDFKTRSPKVFGYSDRN